MAGNAVAPPYSLWGTIRHHARAWYWATRPFSLTASVVPIAVATALAFQDGKASLPLFLLMLVASLLVQVGTNLVDEYADHARPEGKRKLIAPYKVIALGMLSSGDVRTGAVACFSISTANGAYLVLRTGWPLLAFCLASLLVAFLYAGGPLPLGSLGLGWPLVFLFMGVGMVVASYYVHTHTLATEVWWLSLPVAFLVTAILIANDLRDLEEDSAVGKKTPVTLWGRSFGRWAWTLMLLGAYATVATLVATGQVGALLLLVFLTLPQALGAGLILWREEGRPALSAGMRGTATLHWRFGLLMAVGIALERFLPI